MAQKDTVISEPRAQEGFLAGKARFIIGGLVIVAAVAFLMFRGYQSSAVYYLTVDELKAKGPAIYGEDVRLAAVVDKSSVDWDAKNLVLRFNVVQGSETIPVVYNGVVPDTFNLAESVVVEGEYTSEGIFQAHTLFVQCPSKYETKLKGQQ
ncbi:MAG: cytochrome c maturation protein CcmE [Anaerolineae bacterium]